MRSRRKSGQIRAARGAAVLAIALTAASYSGSVRAEPVAESCLAAHEQAQVARLNGHLVESREALRACTQSVCPRPVRDDCSAWLVDVERALPSLVFAVDDGAGHDLHDVRVSTAGRELAAHADGRAVFLDPGVQRLRFDAAGYAPAEQEITVREGEKQRLIRVNLRRVTGAPTPAPRAQAALPGDEPAATRALRWRRTSGALAGVGAAALAAGAGFAVRGQRMAPHCDRPPPAGEESSCSAHFHEQGRRAYLLADIGFAAGGALLGVAALSLWRALRLARVADVADHTATLAANFDRRGFLLALTLPTSL